MADADAIEDAILAFDAGNHAWGRFRHFVLPEAAIVTGTPADTVLEPLREAAISVPDARAGAIGPFLTALCAAQDSLRQYRAAMPAGIPSGEVDAALDGIAEAVARLHDSAPAQ